MIDQQAALIDALDKDAMRALLPVLVDARNELQRGLHAWLAAAPDNDQRYTVQQHRRAMLALQGALNRVASLSDDMRQVLAANGGAAGALAMHNLVEQVARFGVAFGETITPVDLDTTALIARGDRLRYRHYKTSARRYAGQVGEDIRHQLAIGVAQGETFAQLKARLVKLVGPAGMVATRGILGDPGATAEYIAEGLFKRHRYWAERLVRTELIEHYNALHERGIGALNEHRDPKRTSEYLKRWDASLDKRACPICRDLDRRVAREGQPFPGGYERAPAHPNCRCVLVAWHASWGDMKGEVPAHESASEALAATALPPPRVRKPRTIAAAAAKPVSVPPPSLGDMSHAIDAAARGKWALARGALEADITRTEGYPAAELAYQALHGPAFKRNSNVRVRRLRRGVLGLMDPRDGLISIHTEQAGLAQRLALTVRRAEDEVHDAMRAAADVGKGKTSTPLTPEQASHVRAVHGMHTLVHEVMHTYGPLGARGVYRGAAVMVEESATEMAARRYMRLRLGVPLELYDPKLQAAAGISGSYNGWIGGIKEAIRVRYGTTAERAERVLEEAADHFKRRAPGTVDTPLLAVKALADDIHNVVLSALDSSASPHMVAVMEQELLSIARMRP